MVPFRRHLTKSFYPFLALAHWAITGSLLCFVLGHAQNKEKVINRSISRVDAIIQKGARLYLFRYYAWQSCTLTKTDVSQWNKPGPYVRWKQLARPADSWEPVQVFSAPSKNIYVVEMSQHRIWQLDHNLQLLSSLPAPGLPNGRQLNEYTVYLTKNNRFTFIHRSLGVAIQYRETGGNLKEHLTQKLSLHIDRCVTGAWQSLQNKSVNHLSFPFLCQSHNKFRAYDAFLSKKITLNPDSLADYKKIQTPVLPENPLVTIQNGKIVELYKLGSFHLRFDNQSGLLSLCES